jgi:hypothetical protein
MWKIYSRFTLFIRSIVLASKTYWSFSYNRLYLLLILILQIFIWYWSAKLFFSLSDDFFIFHYTVDYGIDLVSRPVFIFIIASLALFFSIFNIILSLILANKKLAKLYWHLFGTSTIIINFFLSLSLFSIFLINFR